MIRVLLFEDNKNLRESLAMYLSATDGIWFIDAYPNAKEAWPIVKKHKPDVVLMDIQMPQRSGIDAMVEIRKNAPDVKVLIQTVFEDDDKIFQAICSGASGYIIKNPNPEVYVKAIREVNTGGSHLSPSIARRVLEMFQHQFVKSELTFVELTQREQQVLRHMVKGMSYKMIADACNISFSTVATHVNHIYEKLHVNSAPEAVVKALEWHLV
ncbi:response regulator [Dyadobacter psychrophilus]|uniref:DNA-binding response regulator, NarL/FixJ family, contains REC and HTH domains n=1 Tax=Dyadobacter psychrophilus TaxID=651661 RepID=A0A1T5EGD7_9BACT|nr:response regulator transcription factor [Dyadobacter psychrophilus]SKB82750.1 DNA-binding response regulator, NarL/FixJ family, contains REC and HTH domains [Dyadobacter psychrophilus]